MPLRISTCASFERYSTIIMEKSQEFEERQIAINGLQVHYTIEGSGPVLLILHGWGSSSKSWVEFQKNMAREGYNVIVPDLPGFGATSPPLNVWGVKEYAHFIAQFVGKLGIQRFCLIGHSFGGQTAIQFAHDYPGKTEKLVLLAAAGIRRNLSGKEKILRSLVKPLNILLSLIPLERMRDRTRIILYRMVGRSDYARAKGIMRKIMARIIREDLTVFLSKIEVPTLMIWGDRDKETPVEDGHIMKQNITGSSLVILPGVGHRLQKEAPEILQETVLNFLKG